MKLVQHLEQVNFYFKQIYIEIIRTGLFNCSCPSRRLVLECVIVRQWDTATKMHYSIILLVELWFRRSIYFSTLQWKNYTRIKKFKNEEALKQPFWNQKESRSKAVWIPLTKRIWLQTQSKQTRWVNSYVDEHS